MNRAWRTLMFAVVVQSVLGIHASTRDGRFVVNISSISSVSGNGVRSMMSDLNFLYLRFADALHCQ